MPGLDEKGGPQGQQILKAGTISFDGSGIDCLVRKMSGHGANLEVESQIVHGVLLCRRGLSINPAPLPSPA